MFPFTVCFIFSSPLLSSSRVFAVMAWLPLITCALGSSLLFPSFCPFLPFLLFASFFFSFWPATLQRVYILHQRLWNLTTSVRRNKKSGAKSRAVADVDVDADVVVVVAVEKGLINWWLPHRRTDCLADRLLMLLCSVLMLAGGGGGNIYHSSSSLALKEGGK